MKDIFDLIARFLLSFIFLARAGSLMSDFERAEAELIQAGWSLMPKFSIIFVIFMIIVGGLLVLTGYRSKLGAAILIIVLLPATIIYHDFWNFPEIEQQEHLVQFIKNMSILGGLMMLMIHGSGQYSVKKIFATINT